MDKQVKQTIEEGMNTSHLIIKIDDVRAYFSIYKYGTKCKK